MRHHGYIQFPPETALGFLREIALVPRRKTLRHDLFLDFGQPLKRLNERSPPLVHGAHVGLDLFDIHTEKHVLHNIRLVIGLTVKTQGPTVDSLPEQFRAILEPGGQKKCAVDQLAGAKFRLPTLVNVAGKIEGNRQVLRVQT